ncbi:MAG TPA: helix-turn-helix domain-containing protein [Nitrososphaerales archaeon]|nr:helix-turn-helix domain-containing protein [Nitrososphaerales archaeon]
MRETNAGGGDGEHGGWHSDGEGDRMNPDVPNSLRSERDGAVLNFIEEEELTGFTFDGLRRKMGTHPETLSRILGRLQEDGIVEAAADGYRVTDKARGVMVIHPLATTSNIPLLSTLLPYDIGVREIVSELKGRWFGTLRWIGYSENEEGTTLKWVTENGRVQIDAKFSNGELHVEAKAAAGNTLNDAVRAAHELVGHISRIYSRSRFRRSARLQMFNTYLTLA